MTDVFDHARASMEAVLRNAPAGLALVQGRTFRWVNREMEAITGFTPDELVGREGRCLYETDREFDRVGTILDHALHSRETRMTDSRWKTKSRGVVSVHLRAGPMDPDDPDVGLILSVLDITDWRRNEEEGERRLKYLEAVLRDAPDAIITLDADHRIIEWNPAAEEIFGYTREEAVGKNPDDLLARGVVSDEAKRLTHRVLQGRKIHPIRTVRHRKDGAPVHVTVSGSPIKIGGRLRGIIALYTDLSTHRRLELQLQRAQKLEAIGTLAGGVAHDFNNILMGIQGRVSLMLMDTLESHPHHEHLKSIEEHTRSATGLTRQLLGFASRSRVEARPTDINEVIRKTADMFGRTRKEIRIHMRLQPGLPLVQADPGQIEQVLLNLYVNSWQAMPAGGDLHLETESVSLEFSSASPISLSPGAYVRISVRDTGIGMDEAIQERIFDPFFTTKKRDRGTGLGLASAYGIITQHKGAIRVQSRRGQGAEFIIHLPAAAEQTGADSRRTGAGTSSPPLCAGNETILLVDDEEMVLEVARDLLLHLGYQVILAHSGREAVEIYEERGEKIDLVVLDMIMPEMGGGATFDALKQMDPMVRVLLSSGYSEDGRARSILQRGCCGFIQKPFDIHEFSRRLREVLDAAPPLGKGRMMPGTHPRGRSCEKNHP